MNNEFLELVKKNPDLPIYAWVDAEIVGDGFGYWSGQFGRAEIREYAKVEPYGYYDRDYIFRDDYEEYLEYVLNKEEELTEEEAINSIENLLEYKKAIFVYVNIPDNF